MNDTGCFSTFASHLCRRGKAAHGLRAAALFGAAALLTGTAMADTLNYVIPFPAGGDSDVTARIQEPLLTKFSGDDVIIQYKAGGGGATAWASLNKMPADGSTVVGINLPHIFLQPMAQNVGYKTSDIAAVYIFQLTPDAIVVPADSPYKTLKDLIAAAKAKPGAVTLSGSGTNTGPHLSATTFDKLAGIKTTYVPFGGTAPSVVAMLGKQVNAAMTFTTAAIQQGDKVRMLAVALDERMETHPDVPTFKELGIDMTMTQWYGLAAPAGTPPAVLKVLSEHLSRALADPTVQNTIRKDAAMERDLPMDQFKQYILDDIANYRKAATPDLLKQIGQ